MKKQPNRTAPALLSVPILMLSACGAMMGATESSDAPNDGAKPVPTISADQVKGFEEGNELIKQAAVNWSQTVATPNPSVLRAYVLYDNWAVERSPAGVATQRWVQSSVWYRGGESNKCFSIPCKLIQNENQGQWSDPMLSCDNSMITEYSCDSMSTLPGEPPAG